MSVVFVMTRSITESKVLFAVFHVFSFSSLRRTFSCLSTLLVSRSFFTMVETIESWTSPRSSGESASESKRAVTRCARFASGVCSIATRCDDRMHERSGGCR